MSELQVSRLVIMTIASVLGVVLKSIETSRHSFVPIASGAEDASTVPVEPSRMEIKGIAALSSSEVRT